MAEEGFFSRWSRRKATERLGQASDEPVSSPDRSPVEPADRPASAAQQAPAPRNDAVVPPVETGVARDAGTSAALPPPTLEDARKLAPGSNIAAFLDRRVDEATRRLALKKLFSDPHFNQMDGLDVYIDDYSIPDPIPADMLREMQQARSLGLFDETETATTKASDGADTDAAASASEADELAPESVPAVPAVAATPSVESTAESVASAAGDTHHRPAQDMAERAISGAAGPEQRAQAKPQDHIG